MRMAVRFNGADWFFHVPRCGGNYTRRVISRLSINGKRALSYNVGHGHASPLRIKRPMRRSFCIIRENILAWYRSFYRYRIYKRKKDKGYRVGHPLDFGIWKDPVKGDFEIQPFEHFVGYAITQFPHGYVTGLYCQYAPFVDTVLFTETLTQDIQAMFEAWGYDTPITIPPHPTNGTPKDVPVNISEEMVAELADVEAGATNYITQLRKADVGAAGRPAGLNLAYAR